MSLWTLDSGTVTLDSGVFTWDGFGPEVTTGPSPLGGAGGQFDWLRDVESRPNWYFYPREEKRLRTLKKRIERSVARRQRIERRMSFAPSNSVLQELLAGLNAVQKQIDSMVATYERVLATARQRNVEIDEEVLSLIV